MFDQIVDLVHLLATVLWLGGGLFIKMTLDPAMKTIDPREAGKLNAAIAKRFSMIAWISILLLIVTGFLKTPDSMFFDTSSEAGVALAVKHVLVLGVVVVGFMIGLVAVPKMRKAAPAPGAAPSPDFIQAQQMIRRLSMTSTIFGVGVLICATFLW